MTIRLTLPVPPSLNVYYRKYRNRMVISEEGEAFKLAVFYAARLAKIGAGFQVGEVAVTVTWYREAKRGDLDNRMKALLDALQGICYYNDSQVGEIHLYREDSDKAHPRVDVTVARRQKEMCKQNP